MTISGLQTTQSQSLMGTASTHRKHPDESRMAKEAISKFDANNDGKLDKVEISTMAEEMSKNGPALSADQLMAADTDGDGAVSASELEADMKAHKPQGPPPDKAADATDSKKLFSQLDTDGNGSLSESEFMALVQGSQTNDE